MKTPVAGVLAANGQTTGLLPEDIIHSRFIILWGTNTALSNPHLWLKIQEARKQGAKLAVVDPFQSQSAMEADWHIQPVPGTDTVLALAMMQVILSEGLQDQDYIDQYTLGINVGHLREKQGPPFLDINGADAAARGIKDGDVVKAYNQNGELAITARIRKKVRPGVRHRNEKNHGNRLLRRRKIHFLQDAAFHFRAGINTPGPTLLETGLGRNR